SLASGQGGRQRGLYSSSSSRNATSSGGSNLLNRYCMTLSSFSSPPCLMMAGSHARRYLPAFSSHGSDPVPHTPPLPSRLAAGGGGTSLRSISATTQAGASASVSPVSPLPPAHAYRPPLACRLGGIPLGLPSPSRVSGLPPVCTSRVRGGKSAVQWYSSR